MPSLVTDAITRLDQEIDEVSGKLRVIRDELKDLVQSTDEWQELQELLAKVGTVRTKLRIELERNGQYNHLKSEQDELSFKRKDLKEILSHHLVEYKIEQKMDSVVMPDATQKPIVLSGKLGKPEPENLRMQFTGDVEVTGPSGEVIHRSADAQARHDIELRDNMSNPELAGAIFDKIVDPSRKFVKPKKWPIMNKAARRNQS